MNMNLRELSEQVYKDNQNDNSSVKEFGTIEEELAYWIMQQRYENLCAFLGRQKEKYNLTETDVNELRKIWFIYNDLKEIHFIGTDIYSDTMFVKHKIPYLYRSVGRDTETQKDKVSSRKMGKKIYEECLKQIEAGGRGSLFSYSKCFGRMLFKYANIKKYDYKEITIEIRKDPWINVIFNEKGEKQSIQGYLRNLLEKEEREIVIPHFSVEVSNVRDDDVENLKKWFEDYLGEKMRTGRNEKIYDPIGDAEVVSNFTNKDETGLCSKVIRYTLNEHEFCVLLYKYTKEFMKQKRKTDELKKRICETLEGLEPRDKKYCEKIMNDEENDVNENVKPILQYIDWENEKGYMTEENLEFEIYKDKSAENQSSIWKNTLKAAINGKVLRVKYI